MDKRSRNGYFGVMSIHYGFENIHKTVKPVSIPASIIEFGGEGKVARFYSSNQAPMCYLHGNIASR